MSLLDAVYVISRKRRVMGPQAFKEWINARVPHRIIPQQFMAIETLPPRLRKQPTLPGFEFIHLPEHLPGM
jgi:hypothetical protein